MKIAYFDCGAGISGDMCLGALIHAGVNMDQLKDQLATLPLSNYRITPTSVIKRGISATQVHVTYEEQNQPSRHLKDITAIINQSTLLTEIKEKSIAVFTRLAEAEARVHGCTVDQVHFHEVGAVDAIIDIVGTVTCLSLLQVEKIISSPLPMGHGFVRCAHGLIPIPAPATLELLRNIPIYGVNIEGELVTPTGAAIITTLADSFGPFPTMNISTIGLGSGEKDFDIPNILRISLGEENSPFSYEEITVIEASIDDMNPEFYSYLWEQAFSRGALDIFLIPIYMKKGRPGNLVTVLCYKENLEKLITLFLQETTSLGTRIRTEKRFICPRKTVTVNTKYGQVDVKIGFFQGHYDIAPEYENCRLLAKKKQIPLKDIYLEALLAARIYINKYN
ncbi:MAG: nickel pincer cofactor biosynthesis protein LarC [Bacillota bacterium]|jgi:uncharacterized protein (TIGR00299 family) protein